MNVRLSVEIAGIKMRNPFMLASGIHGSSGPQLKRVIEAGAGAVVTKTLTASPREGYEAPIIYVSKCYILNAVGLANPGIKNFKNDIEIARKGNAPVIVSIAGSTIDEFSWMAGLAEDYGADGIELNLSCPHVKGLGTDLGEDPEAVYEVVREVKKSVKIPVFPKLTPNISDITLQGKAAEKAGADGLVAINTLRGMAIDVELKKPILSNVYGGVSGPAILPISVYSVYRLWKTVKIPIIGVGGVENWRDAVQLILAGASCIQVGTGILKHGIKIFRKLENGLIKYMKRHGFKNIKEMVGYAVTNYTSGLP